MAQESVALVTGAGGFIGHHLVKYLVARGYRVVGADLKLPEFEVSDAHEFMVCDLRSAEDCMLACAGIDEVYQLAADMGGIGYITSSHADISINNILINAHMLSAARQQRVKRFLFSSSACGSAEGRGCFPGRSGRGVRLGKAVHREAVPVHHRGPRHGDARRPLP